MTGSALGCQQDSMYSLLLCNLVCGHYFPFRSAYKIQTSWQLLGGQYKMNRLEGERLKGETCSYHIIEENACTEHSVGSYRESCKRWPRNGAGLRIMPCDNSCARQKGKRVGRLGGWSLLYESRVVCGFLALKFSHRIKCGVDALLSSPLCCLGSSFLLECLFLRTL